MIGKILIGCFLYLCVCLVAVLGTFAANGIQEPCTPTWRVVSIKFSASKYPHIRDHAEDAIRAGWPRILRLKRTSSDERRDTLLDQQPKQSKGDKLDMDEYPPAVGRSSWKASVRLVPERENRSHGATLGNRISTLCEGARFKYVWR